MAIALAGNLIGFSKALGFNWGHLQIVNTTSNDEIEVQAWINPHPGEPMHISIDQNPLYYFTAEGYFQFNPVRNHSGFTDYAPGSENDDSKNYKMVELGLNSGQEESSVW